MALCFGRSSRSLLRGDYGLDNEHRRRRSGRRRVFLLNHTTVFVVFLLLIILPFNGHVRTGNEAVEHDGGGHRWTGFASAASVAASTTAGDEESESGRSRSRLANAAAASSSKPSPLAQRTTKDGRPTLNAVLVRAGKRGLGGGLPGAVAGAVQVLTLMWLRTVINHQYRYGSTFSGSLRRLLNEGGVPRLYRGLWFALFQAPVSRFVSVASNDGVDALLSSFESTRRWGPGRGTILASVVVGLTRMLLMPIDTCKTVLQVDSVEGFRSLMRKVKAGKISVLYQGALAQALSSVVAHYPWFYTYNTLNRAAFAKRLIPRALLRNASIGFFSSVVSDTVSNAIRVVKTTKQAVASKHSVSYADTVSMILAADGWRGLFGRGLRTRMLANGLQSVMFTIIWRGLADRFRKPDGAAESESVGGATTRIDRDLSIDEENDDGSGGDSELADNYMEPM